MTPDGRARLVTLNLWGEQPPFERRMELILEGLRALEPDLVTLQEVREVPGKVPNMAQTLAEQLGFQVAYAVATPWGGGEEGLGILSRWPIAYFSHRELPHAVPEERRRVLGAAITSPGGELPVFTTHLNYRLTDGAKREDQVAAIDHFVAEWAKNRPTPLPRLLAGDFNATPEHDEIRFLRGLRTVEGRRVHWQDAWHRLHEGEPGWTWARANPQTARLHWLDRDRRIDYVFVSPVARDGRGEIHECRIVLDLPGTDGVFPSDHYGLLAEVQIAPLYPA
jgi:endonuclease/exonuclease/phosphatase family metal-dependent hydrolase